jgi:glycine/D-amino acid oxidase-like deaminating enzyme
MSAYDAVVIGGGPAGSVAAGFLARRGLRVALFERERFPRYHIGESLLSATMPILEGLGVMPAIEAAGFVRKPGGTFIWGAHAETGGVTQQQVVELRPHDVKGVRPPARIVGEGEAPRLGVRAPDERSARLAHEARRLDRRHDAQPLEDRHGRRQQRFADVIARKPLALEERHAQPAAGEKPRRDTARRPAADDDGVVGAHAVTAPGPWPARGPARRASARCCRAPT